MERLPTYLFWISLSVIAYVYFGYPLILFILSLFLKRKVKVKENYKPKVSLIIAAYNEERVIKLKLKNSLSLDYPRDKLEIIVASNGCNDKTDKIVKKFLHRGVILDSTKEKIGKTEAQNRAVKIAKGEVIVFSDANSIYKRDALKKLVRGFSDPKVGCVCGELKYKKGRREMVESIYWKYEKIVKRLESKIGSMVGANGSIYTVRKKDYMPLKPDSISDFLEPIKIFEKGYRVVYEPEAICHEKPSENIFAEFRRKVRIIVRGLASVKYLTSFLNPLKNILFSYELWTHKFIRWFLFPLLIAVFISNIFLVQQNKFYYWFLIVQGIILFFAFLGLISVFLNKKIKVFHFFLYFLMVNFAGLVALVKFILGERMTTYKKAR
ncbi:glycosyltransferase family 2 protein [bacterium (Candidatus Torokbacteria) CG_4_10_14_0_2_um_filter_35_8]|nr:MAG: glycosyltransferase family 2 protein [bacterium (Candidatus Torokbacteria) CG_4_10_14_0_2_um_filter_35_8]